MITDRALQLGLTHDDLLAGLSVGRGRRKAARAVLFADSASESPPESESRARITAAGLELPEIQVDVFTADGDCIARSDFYCGHVGWPWRQTTFT